MEVIPGTFKGNKMTHFFNADITSILKNFLKTVVSEQFWESMACYKPAIKSTGLGGIEIYVISYTCTCAYAIFES